MLSAEQQKMVEQNLWVVNDVLKDLHLQRDEDLRQECNLYLCKCVQRFDPEKSAKWSTYAYCSIVLYILNCQKRRRKVTKNESDFCEFAQEPNAQVKCTVDTVCEVRDIYASCNEKEIRVLELLRKGYKLQEISHVTRQSINTVRAIIKRIRERTLQNY